MANAQLEWTSNEIPARSFISMDIVWNPTVVWSTREIIQFTDNRNFKKDVAVILKSIDKTQQSKVTLKKSSAIKSHTVEYKILKKKMPIKSPSPRTKMQRNRLSTLAAVNSIGKKDSPLTGRSQMKKVLGTSNQNGFSNVSIHGAKPIHEKENMQPQSPPNMSFVLDSITFTPATKNKQNTNMDYLASLPTPNSHLDKNQSYTIRVSETSTHIYRNLNETETIISTPSTKLNDETTVFSNLQTPNDRTEVDYSRYYLSNRDQNKYAMQKTPGFNCESSFRFNMDGAMQTPDIFAVPGRKLNLDISNISPNKEHDQSHVINRTQTLSSPIGLPKLSMIAEEQSKSELSETYIKQNEHHLTYNLEYGIERVETAVNVEKVETPKNRENLVRDVQLISTPLSKKYMSMKELGDNNSNLSLEQQILKNNQGSMPNLNKLEKVKSIENNRYFYQSIEKGLQETENIENVDELNENLGDTSICSVQSTVSTLSVAFHEHEIQAQSSRLNLHEIGQSKTTKQTNNFYFTIDKPTPKQSIGMNRLASNKYLSASSPTVNKTVEKPKLSHSIKDLSSSAKNRPSVISYASRNTLHNSSSQKKRTRDENLDSSKKSLNKLSPPKRVCIEPEAPKLSKGQAFRTKTWGGVMPKKFRIPSIPPQRLQLKRPEEERVILYDPELHMRSKCSKIK